jgi:hypothetical protein
MLFEYYIHFPPIIILGENQKNEKARPIWSSDKNPPRPYIYAYVCGSMTKSLSVKKYLPRMDFRLVNALPPSTTSSTVVPTLEL